MNLQSLYWVLLIKLCRSLTALGLENAAEWVGDRSGLKARIISLLDSEGVDTEIEHDLVA